MKLTFIGGARTVTGSCYLLEVGNEKLLIDCGLFQGSKELEERNAQPWPFVPSEISYVLLTHAHIDHSGRLPLLKRDGFRGKIICTKSTKDLCEIMLPDSGHIQELEAEWKNRKRSRQRKPLVEPLYTADDARDVLSHFVSVPYYETIELTPSISIRMRDAGHILGSAIIEVWAEEDGKRTKIVFSGDIGSTGQAIVRDPDLVEEADYLLVESTYGNRSHPPRREGYEQLYSIIQEARKDKGVVLIPAFAVGRTQELLYQFNQLFNQEKILDVPVYVDSPLAISATEVFRANTEIFDEEAHALIDQGDNPLAFPNLHFVRSREESQKLNFIDGCAVVISASGMADAGRILHHLKHQLWKPNNHVVFVGYQAEGSLGRRLITGAKAVRIMGQHVRVGAKIHDLSVFSAHADCHQLMDWLKGFTKPPKQVFIVHGEEDAAQAFAANIRETFGWSVHIPSPGQTVMLEEGHIAEEAVSEVAAAAQVGDRADEYDIALVDAELKAYLGALERNLAGLQQVLSNHGLSEKQRLFLEEEVSKLLERIDELAELD